MFFKPKWHILFLLVIQHQISFKSTENGLIGKLISLFVCLGGRQGEADWLDCNPLQRVGIPFFRDLASRPRTILLMFNPLDVMRGYKRWENPSDWPLRPFIWHVGLFLYSWSSNSLIGETLRNFTTCATVQSGVFGIAAGKSSLKAPDL